MKGHARRGIVRKERQCGHDAEHEGNDDAEVADGDGDRRALPEVRHVDVEPDAEHEEDDAELAQQPQDIERRRGKEKREACRPELADERRAEQEPGGNLSDDRRLPQESGETAHCLCGKDDDAAAE